jgi:hypothetical protein
VGDDDSDAAIFSEPADEEGNCLGSAGDDETQENTTAVITASIAPFLNF